MDRRNLPTDIQTFRKIREGDCCHVDKTRYARKLVDEGTHFFLSRPRRFGKSLFVDTLKEPFEGSEELFDGLDVHRRWDWSVRHPVVRLDFGGGNFAEPGELHRDVMEQLAAIERRAGVTGDAETASGRLGHLIETLHEDTGRRVVLLVDGYDNPILDALGNSELARANRDYLGGLYGTIKRKDADLEFSFLTGVSKFTGTSLFSGVNNLIDITLDPDCSAICGFTESDLDSVFAAELDGLDRDRIQEWYNGYSWLGDDRVYNPFGILRLFRYREFKAWWFETGAPRFLADTMASRDAFSVNLEEIWAGEGLLSAFDVDEINPEALLFQTGCLMLTDRERSGTQTRYRLGYPNREVRESLNRWLLRRLAPRSLKEDDGRRGQLAKLLETGNFDGMEDLFHAVFAGIPHQWRSAGDVAKYEAWFASAYCSYFLASGLDVRAEDATNRGRIDMAVVMDRSVHVFAFMVPGTASGGDVMRQLRERGHAEKYGSRGVPVYFVGVEFDPEERNVATFEAVQA